MTAILGMLRLVPVKAWLAIAAIIAVSLWYWRATDAAYQRGKTDAISAIEKGARDAEKRAETELRRLDRGDDRSVRGFDRDD